MEELSQQLARMQNLTYQLVEKYERAANEAEHLRQANEELQGQNRNQNRELEMLRSDLDSAKMAASLASNGDGGEMAKAKIGSLAWEIDRCIALLNE